MEDQQFDAFTKRMAGTTSRRRMLQLLLGAAGGLALLGHPQRGVGQSECGFGEVECYGICADPNSDRSNCGRCGNFCGFDEDCQGGVCTGGGSGSDPQGPFGVTCRVWEVVCAEDCVDPYRDRFNCGGCGLRCPADSSCENGQCFCRFPGEPCGGVCVDTFDDHFNCGECGLACPAGVPCRSGQCACPVLREICAGRCVDPFMDPDHCGRCGNACARDSQCVGGQCEPAPPLSPSPPGAVLDAPPWGIAGVTWACVGPSRFIAALPERIADHDRRPAEDFGVPEAPYRFAADWVRVVYRADNPARPGEAGYPPRGAAASTASVPGGMTAASAVEAAVLEKMAGGFSDLRDMDASAATAVPFAFVERGMGVGGVLDVIWAAQDGGWVFTLSANLSEDLEALARGVVSDLEREPAICNADARSDGATPVVR